MESANFHHHQQQDHQLDDSSISWSPNPISNGTTNNINSRNLDTCTDSMVQDLGFPYYVGMGYPIDNYVTHELQRLARIKDEFSVAESYYPKFLELLNCSPTSSNIEDLHLQQPYSSYMKNNDHHQLISYSNTNNQDLSLASFSAGCQIKGGQIINDPRNCSKGTFSQIFPTTSILSLNQSTTTTTSSSSSSSSSSAISSTSPFDMNCLPALDLFGSPRFDGHFSHHSSLNTYNLGGRSYGFDRLHQSNHRPAVCPNKISPRVSNTGRSTDQSTKRPASKYIGDAAKATQTVPMKKPKSEPRSSGAPFQVRKEKLGDRIAAIQQLVAPFGKTDTASVLMEAIGYIKFLQTQVQVHTKRAIHEVNKQDRWIIIRKGPNGGWKHGDKERSS